MKKAKVESKNTLKATKNHCVAGVRIRSGVKAGRGKRGGESRFGRGGRSTDISGRLG